MISFTKVIADIRNAYKEHLNVWLAAGLIATGLSLPAYFFGSPELAAVLALALSLILMTLIYPGIISMALLSVRGKKPTLSEIPKMVHLSWKMLGLVVVYGMIVALGLVALIIPGIYLAARYWPATYILVDSGKVGVFDSFTRAQNLTKGKILALISAFAVIIIFYIAVTILPEKIMAVITDVGSWWRDLISIVVAVAIFPASAVTGASIYKQITAKK